MPLLDHFQPPLSRERHWESFHASWIGALADDLNRRQPERYFAEEQIHAGPSVEIEMATLQRSAPPAEANGGAVATLPPHVWAPPVPAHTLTATFADDFEVRVFSSLDGPTLVAAIAMVSPGNKDRPEERRAFATKCASYLHQGVALLLIDIVTPRHAIMHNEILRLLDADPTTHLPADARRYAVAYRPIRRGEQMLIHIWPARFAVGDALPVLPLALNAELALPVDLEATYTDACRRRRIL